MATNFKGVFQQQCPTCNLQLRKLMAQLSDTRDMFFFFVAVFSFTSNYNKNLLSKHGQRLRLKSQRNIHLIQKRLLWALAIGHIYIYIFLLPRILNGTFVKEYLLYENGRNLFSKVTKKNDK